MLRKIFKITFFLLLLSVVRSPWSVVHPLPKDPHYPLAKALLVSKSLSTIDRYYYSPARIETNTLYEAALMEIQRSIPEILAKCEKDQFCAVTVNQAVKRFNYPEGGIQGLRGRLQEIFAFMERHTTQDTERHDIEYAAIRGLLEALDPHSNFMDPDAYREFRVGTEGEFGGLGIVISIKEGRLTVTAPLEGTPAWQAGMKTGDHIIQIDEESTINMSLTEAVQKLRGRPGTPVTLKVEREGKKEPFPVTLTRAIINIQAVQSKLVKTGKAHPVGFLRIKSFQSNTKREVYQQLQRMLQKTPHLAGVILDLRNNPGGLLDQAVLLADVFLKEGTIVSTVGRGGRLMDRKEAKDDGLEKDFPLIVLVNEGSASASEIVAGALKNNDRALIIGSTTFGKGTVQSIYELPWQAAIKITVGQYYTPGDQSIQSVGITPDIELFPVHVDKEQLDTIENIRTFEKDLEKHLAQETTLLENPQFRLRFFQEVLKEDETVEYSTQLDLKGDTAAALALDMMDVLTGAFRPAMLEEIAPLLEQKQSAEEDRIVGQFEKLGLDWKKEKEAGTPQAQMSYHLLQGGREVSSAKAGEEVTLKIRLKNVGDGPFYRLAAQTDSKIYAFKNYEFAFGKIAPQESRTWENVLKIPKSSPTEEVSLQLRFEELYGKTPPPVDIVLPIRGLPRPHFAHQFSLEEKGFEKLKTGSPVILEVEVANEGEGISFQPVVALKNLGGKEVFIEKGRVVLTELAPGKKGEADFRFHIDPQTEGKKLALELSITDADLIVRSTQEIVLDWDAQTVLPPPRRWFRPPVITLVHPKEKVGTGLFDLQGEARDDQKIRDLYIFVGDEKTFYEANAQLSDILKFKTSVTLQEGNNNILITARDNDNLVSTHYQIISFEPVRLQKGAL